MRIEHSILNKYIPILVFLLPLICYGQNEAIIIGNITNPQSRTVTFKHRNNPLYYAENSFETTLDEANNFFVRVKSKSPQTIYMEYKEKKYKFYLSPGDTLKVNFDQKQNIDKTVFEGAAATNNLYLLKLNAAFPDFTDDSLPAMQRKKLAATDYQIYVDSLYKAKRRFLENYPVTEINNFSSDFFDFTAQDIQYWRAYILMKYYDDFHLSADAGKIIDVNYFNFLVEVQTSSLAPLNNDYCLKFLSLYLNFIKDKYYALPELPNAVTQRRVVKQTVRPITGNVCVLVDPFTSKEIIGWMSPYNKAEFLNLQTDDKFKYIGSDTAFEDTFLKIKTEEGRIGWVPASSVMLIDNVVIEKNIIERHCFDGTSPLCGLEKYLSGRVLYLVAAKEVLINFLSDDKADSERKLKAYTTANTQYKEYNDFLASALVLTYQNRNSSTSELHFNSGCELSDTQIEKKTATVLNSTSTVSDKSITGVKVTVKSVPANFINFDYSKNEKKDFVSITQQTPTKDYTDSLYISKSETFTTLPPFGIQLLSENINTDAIKVSDTKAKIVSQPLKEIKLETPLKSFEVAEIKNLPVKSVPVPENKIEKKEILVLAATPELKNKPTETNLDYSEQNKKLFASEAVIDEADFNITKALVLSGLGDKDEKIKKFEGLMLGEKVPEFKFKDLNGKEVDQQELLGKVVFIEFWASWCGPCQAQMSHSQETVKKYKNSEDVVFLFISLDSDPAKWKESLEFNKWNEGIHGNDGVIIPLNFGVQLLPNYFVVDKTGKIAFNSLIKSSKVSEDKMIEKLSDIKK